MSPILPENRARYPGGAPTSKEWRAIREAILDRAGNNCEGCGVRNGATVDRGNGRMVRIVLTIAHLDHQPENNDPANLRALCQRCHNRHDAAHRAESRKRR